MLLICYKNQRNIYILFTLIFVYLNIVSPLVLGSLKYEGQPYLKLEYKIKFHILLIDCHLINYLLTTFQFCPTTACDLYSWINSVLLYHLLYNYCKEGFELFAICTICHYNCFLLFLIFISILLEQPFSGHYIWISIVCYWY